MPEVTEDCPEKKVLSDFLLGKLDPKSSSDCEQHLSRCEPCVETMSALDIATRSTDWSSNHEIANWAVERRR